MKIGFVGAGKVGIAFGAYLIHHGIDVIGYYSRTTQSIQTATKVTGTTPVNTLDALIDQSEMIFVTTGDDQIKDVVAAVARLDIRLEEKTFVHMSGALSSRLFDPLVLKGARSYSAHPIQAFASVDASIKALDTTIFGIEGADDLEPLTSILETTGNRYITLKPDQKSRYHAIACIVSNYLVTLLDVGLELFDGIGISADIGMEAMLPMILGTIDNVKTLGAAKALTGPIARGDVETIRQHLSAFNDDETVFQTFYSYLGQRTLELAQKEKLTDQTKISELENLFR